MADSYKLPGSSYEELVKIIKAYGSGKEGQSVPLDDVSKSTGIERTIISRNHAFLLQLGIILEGKNKTPSETGLNLGRAYLHNKEDEVSRIWLDLIQNDNFLDRMVSAIKIRNGMDKNNLISHILYSAGSTSTLKTGAISVIEILKVSGLISESDGKIQYNNEQQVTLPDKNETQSSKPEVIATNDKIKIEKAVVNRESNINISINITINPSVSEIEEIGIQIKKMIKHLSESDE